MRKYLTTLTGLVLFLLLAGCQSENSIPVASTLSDTLDIPTAINTSLPTSTFISPTAIPNEIIQLKTELSTEIIATQVPSPTPIQSPTSTPSAVPTSTESQPIVECLDEAAFYADVTIPDDTLLEPDTAFTKVWQVRNTGTCTWDAGYSLVFAKGDVMDGPLSNPMPIVLPGEVAEISVNLVAPKRGGQQTGYWEFQNSHGTHFGIGSGGHDYIWVQILVNWSSQEDEQEPTVEPSDTPSEISDCSANEDGSFENQILALINSARESAGLPSLSLNPQLNAAALEHSRDMACSDFVDHTGSNGSTWYDRVATHGYANYSSAHENIYVGDPAFGGTPEGAFTWWMNSQVHRDNILYTSVSEIGIGYVFYSDSTYGGYFTVVFARP